MLEAMRKRIWIRLRSQRGTRKLWLLPVHAKRRPSWRRVRRWWRLRAVRVTRVTNLMSRWPPQHPQLHGTTYIGRWVLIMIVMRLWWQHSGRQLVEAAAAGLRYRGRLHLMRLLRGRVLFRRHGTERRRLNYLVR
jgi:hypothetical protein